MRKKRGEGRKGGKITEEGMKDKQTRKEQR